MNTNAPWVLYVENNPDDVFFLQKAIQKAQVAFELKAVSTVEEAERLLNPAGGPPRPAIILLDYTLDESHTGTELLHWVHSHPEAAAIPIVALCGDDLYSTVYQMYREGARYFLFKPSSIPGYVEIVKCLDHCLAQSPPNLEDLKTLPVYRSPAGVHG